VDDPARWREVLAEFEQHPGGVLALSLSTPWRLTLAVTVYEQRNEKGVYLRNPRTLLGTALKTPDAIAEYLLALLIPAATASHPSPEGTTYTQEQVRAWLTVLARYLDDNASTGRGIDGRTLSGSDIVLHELWPLAGPRRPRAVAIGIMVAIWLTGTAAMLTPASIGLAPPQLVGAGLGTLTVAWATFTAWRTTWPQPTRIDLRRLRTLTVWRSLTAYLAAGSAIGLAYGLAGGLRAAIASRAVPGPVMGGHLLRIDLVIGFAIGLAGGLALGFARLAVPTTAGPVDPRDIVRTDLAGGLAFGLVGGLAVGLAAGAAVGLAFGLTAGLAGGLAFGLVGGLAAGLVIGLAGLRYVALLLCTRRWSRQPLPWRLGRFLHWCYGAGLIRIAGIGYQFRHRELQDYLAREETR
jgi:hypothetical protein